MKITPSKDGEMRGNLKVPFRVSLDNIVDAIIIYVTNEWDFSTCDNISMKVETALKYYSSKAKIIKEVEKAFHKYGMDVWARVEGCASDTTINEIREQSRVLVLKKFPSFKVKKDA